MLIFKDKRAFVFTFLPIDGKIVLCYHNLNQAGCFARKNKAKRAKDEQIPAENSIKGEQK